MHIKFKRGATHLGYAYRAGSIAASLPDKDCEYLIEVGIAEDVTPKPKPRKAKVQKAVIEDTTKSVVEDTVKTVRKRKK